MKVGQNGLNTSVNVSVMCLLLAPLMVTCYLQVGVL